jgi:hypothetical protein
LELATVSSLGHAKHGLFGTQHWIGAARERSRRCGFDFRLIDRLKAVSFPAAALGEEDLQ